VFLNRPISLVLLVLAASGCEGGKNDDTAYDDDATASVSGIIETVATVTWTPADGADSVRVEYGKTDAYGAETPAQDVDGGAVTLPLFGMAVESIYHYRVVETIGGEDVVGQDHELQTGAPHDDPREATLITADADQWPGFTLVALSTPAAGSDVVIYNADGEIVWYWPVPTGDVLQTRLASNGRDILYMVDNPTSEGEREIVRVSMDGTTVETLATPRSHHDFVEIPGIQYAYIAADPQTYEGELVYGDKIVEIANDGTETVVWDAFDQLPVVQHSGWDYPFYDDGRDWTHANGLCYDPAENVYYLSLYWLHEILKIDRATGETLWILSGDAGDGDFTLPEGEAFGPQHGPLKVDGGLYFFDNHSDVGDSRLVHYDLDESTLTATKVWDWSRDGLTATTLGDITVLDDGRLLSSWGDAGEIIAFAPDLETIIWDLDHEPGSFVSQVEMLDTLYPPAATR
jgi:hypothetical protein